MVTILLFVLWHLSEALLFTVGSCAGFHPDLKNPAIWHSIKRLNPDAFIWVGDAVYSDRGDNLFKTIKPSEEKHWKPKYDAQKKEEGYKELRESTRILGIWDDHDYGPNNSNKLFPYKEISKKAFLDFLDEPKDSIRYQREGLYDSYIFNENGLKIKIILLDGRTFMDPPGENADAYGELQWKWLENELKDTVDLYLIMSGLQINAEGRTTINEVFHEYSRIRLLNLLNNYPGVILFSGDVHHSEIMKNQCYKYPIYEITTSGLTHSIGTQYGSIFNAQTDFFQAFTYNVGHRVFVKSFASLEIKNKEISIDLRDSNGISQLHHKFPISELYTPATRSYLCDQTVKERNWNHYYSYFLVFYFPYFINILVFIKFMKKYSNSY